MPTIRELEEALAKRPPDEGERQRSRLPWTLSPEAMLWSAEKETAPIAMRDAMLAVLAEARATTRLARWTLLVAVVALVCSAASIAITLLA
jgi:hypothetical protein